MNSPCGDQHAKETSHMSMKNHRRGIQNTRNELEYANGRQMFPLGSHPPPNITFARKSFDKRSRTDCSRVTKAPSAKSATNTRFSTLHLTLARLDADHTNDCITVLSSVRDNTRGYRVHISAGNNATLAGYLQFKVAQLFTARGTARVSIVPCAHAARRIS